MAAHADPTQQPDDALEQAIGEGDSVRARAVRKAVGTWQRQLLDYSGNNRLIYYRHLKRATLDLADAEPEVVAQLRSGSKVKLSKLFPAGDEDENKLQNDAIARTRTINANALAHLEERGINTLFLASELVTWEPGDTSKATPNSPLLLAPMTIRSLSGGQRDFELALNGDWQINQTLIMFWQQVFGLPVKQEEIDALAEEMSDRPEELAQIIVDEAKAAGVLPGIERRDALLVGTFLYTKLPMVQDIVNNVELLEASDLVAAIAGDEDAGESVRAANASGDIAIDLPDRIGLPDEFLVLDADSSQNHVINTALAGRSLVVQGPPGTGKSQTIANLITTLAARGKSVLFVAEKRAAIEAVAKRLDAVGLANLALDLHSTQLNKKQTALSLASSLEELGQALPPATAGELRRLSSARLELSSYVQELHKRREPWELSSFEVNAALAGAQGNPPPVRLSSETVATLTPELRENMQETMRRWLSARASVDWNSPWLSAGLTSAEAAEQAKRAAERLSTTLLPQALSLAGQAANETGHDVEGLPLPWIAALAGVCDEAQAVNAAAGHDIFQHDTTALAGVLRSKPKLWFGGKSYRGARQSLNAASGRKIKRGEAIGLLDSATEIAGRWQQYGPNGGRPVASPGADSLRNTIEEIRQLAASLGPALTADLEGERLDTLLNAARELTDSDHMASLLGQLADLRAWLALVGLTPVLEKIEHGEVSEADGEEFLVASLHDGIRRAIDEYVPALSTFQEQSHSRVAGEFVAGDRWHLEASPARVVRAIAERAVEVRNANLKQSGVIEKEAARKRGHRPLRRLMVEAADVVTALRPCMMMSPLMVAQALPPRQLFDYIVFDEASQIRPEEAVSAIMRGREVIVAGDSRQLPPTSFFSNKVADEEVDEDDLEVDALTEGYESILDVAHAVLPSRMLTWHYRSQDERLIKLSNDHIYEGSLTTFPGAHRDSPVTFHKVEHHPRDTTEIRSNPTEIATVIDLMIDHATNRPDETLGVIAFGQHHASSIEDALRSRLDEESSAVLDEFFSEEREERVFVKNIERVQGDERDAIILTIGYGKDLEGRVPHRFGPVNQEGGERRINVAASRARRRMMVVSSIAHSDLNTGSLGKGPQLLEALLRFADSGGTDTGADSGAVSLNPFELAVKFELERLGLNPISQYGQSGFRIDFAIPHPDNDGRMVLAVEADGASYHSSPTARDRDRLRQQVLEAKGWRFHRIWSTAFFRDPEGEARKVLESYRAALAGEEVAPPEFAVESSPVPSTTIPKPRIPQGESIDKIDHRQLVALVNWITQNGEKLMTHDQIKAEMLTECGYSRRGSRIMDAFERAIVAAEDGR